MQWNLQLGVLILAVGGQVLADGDSLLDQHVEILGDLRGKACGKRSLSAMNQTEADLYSATVD